jgi:hypothetical protein
MSKKVILAVVLLGILMITGWFIQSSDVLRWDFRNELWAPAYLLVHGESPYNIQGLVDDGIAVWLPQIIVIFFPLGLLPLKQASNLWLIINVLTIIAITIFLIRQRNREPTTLSLYGPLLLGVFLFPPTATYLALGQIDFILIAALLFSSLAIERQDAKAAAGGFVLALAKPQLCFVVLPSVFLWLLLRGKLKYGLQVIAFMIVLLIILTLPFWFADLLWFKDFVRSFLSNPPWLQPALYTQLQRQFGRVGLVLWFAVAILCIAISTIFWNKLRPPRAIIWSLALTTIAAPYIWSWDFTLLLPLFIDTAAQLTKISARLVLLLTWLTCFFLPIWSRQFEASDHRLWWLPYTMLLGVLASLQIQKMKSRVYLNSPL